MGAGLGFFLGPQYAGWRADEVTAGWWEGMARWQVPCLEFGLVGVLFGILFLLIAREVAHEAGIRAGTPMGKGMRRRVLALAAVLGCRDFGGIASMSLVSIYLQKAHGYDTKQAGWIVGAMMLISVVANPLAVWYSPGKKRLRALAGVLVLGGLVLMTVPHVEVKWILPVLAVFQVFHLASYAIGEAAMLERVSPAVRGRVIGLFITWAGTFASSSVWAMGWWTDRLGERSTRPEGYYSIFAVLGAMLVFASLSVGLIARLGAVREMREEDLAQAMSPAIEPMG
jgi:MFS family permease